MKKDGNLLKLKRNNQEELSSENGELLFKEWVQPEIRTVVDIEGNRYWWLQEQFPENKLSKNLKVR